MGGGRNEIPGNPHAARTPFFSIQAAVMRGWAPSQIGDCWLGTEAVRPLGARLQMNRHSFGGA
jgi:hypothetical protein